LGIAIFARSLEIGRLRERPATVAEGIRRLHSFPTTLNLR
jgi:hypothetical protein